MIMKKKVLYIIGIVVLSLIWIYLLICIWMYYLYQAWVEKRTQDIQEMKQDNVILD